MYNCAPGEDWWAKVESSAFNVYCNWLTQRRKRSTRCSSNAQSIDHWRISQEFWSKRGVMTIVSSRRKISAFANRNNRPFNRKDWKMPYSLPILAEGFVDAQEPGYLLHVTRYGGKLQELWIWSHNNFKPDRLYLSFGPVSWILRISFPCLS